MRIILLTLLTVFLFGCAFFFERFHASEIGLKHYVSVIERNLHQQETEVEQLTQQLKSEISQQPNFDYPSFFYDNNLFKKGYNVLLFERDSLSFWGNNKIITSLDSANGVRHLSNGYYLIKKYDISTTHSILVLFPIKSQYNLEASWNKEENYLPESYILQGDEMPLLSISIFEKTNFPIHSLTGTPCCYAKYEQKGYLSLNAQYQLAILYFLFFVCLAYLVNTLALILLRGKYARFGITFFIVAVFGIKLLSFYLDLTHTLRGIPLFTEYLESNSMMNKTPGSMFINIMLILWVIVFYYKNVPYLKVSHFKLHWRVAIAISLYLLILCGIFMTIHTHKQIISSPNLTFDFNDLFYVELSTAITILCLLLIWFALFLFNYKAMANLFNLGFDRKRRSLILVLVLLPTLVILYYSGELGINPLVVVLFCLGYVTALDVYYDNKWGSNLTWFLSWIGIFALSSTSLLYMYKHDADLKSLSDAAYQLASENDRIAEVEFSDVFNIVKKASDGFSSRTQLDNWIKKTVKSKEYLLDHYELTLTDSTVFAEKSSLSLSLPDKNGVRSLLATFPIHLEDGQQKFYRLEGYPLKYQEQKDYQEPLFKIPYFKIKDFSHINYSIFQNDTLKETHGEHARKILPKYNMPAPGKIIEDNTLDQIECLLNTHEGKVVSVRIVYGSIFRAVFPFTYILIFLLGIAFFIITLNTFTNIIDDHFVLNRDGSLQLKIQRAVIGLIAFICVFTAGATVVYMKMISDKGYSSQFAQNTDIIYNNFVNEIKSQKSDSIDLVALSQPISKIHKIDINIYNTNGDLLNIEQKNVYKKGILSTKMNAEALYLFNNSKQEKYIADENIAQFTYKAAYGKIMKNGKILGYFSIPYYHQELERRATVAEMIGTMVSIYILLLIPFVIFSFMIAEKLMEPIRDIGDNLKRVKLGQTKIEMDWNGNDALGDLLREFNTMLSKLGQEAKVEKQSAKDEAWRMMARQIAHDIRNTLTPMKLSIQFLEHTTQNAETEIKEKVARIVRTIVEQINNFNHIATSFADYSKIETQQSAIENTNLNDFISKNCELFLNDLESSIMVNLHLPKDEYTVKMDRAQMSRVITNLITNAKQAIPDNREGRIDIYLSEKDNNAVIRISDNGLGIPSEQMEQIFQPNFTTKNSGSGLGLAICRRLVEDIQGKIYCTSTILQGSDFYVELPIIEKMEGIEAEETEF